MKTVGLLLSCLLILTAANAAELGDDGLHQADWIQNTFMDLSEDLQEANDSGKRLLIMFEQQGCIYCTKMHNEVFSDPDVRSYLQEKYFVVRLNLYGSNEVTDFDGEALEERDMAKKWNIMFTPTMLFLPDTVEKGQSASEVAVATVPGAFGRGTTLDMLTWVFEKRYIDQEDEDFQRYHARRIRERNDGTFD